MWREAGVNVLSASGSARTSAFHIGRGAESQTRSRRVSFAAIKRATAAAKASRADWEHQRLNAAASSASKSCQARVGGSDKQLGRSDLFILLRGGRCAGVSRFLIDEIDKAALSANLSSPTGILLAAPDYPTSPHHRALTFTHDFTIIALSSRARSSHCHALTHNTTSLRSFPCVHFDSPLLVLPWPWSKAPARSCPRCRTHTVIITNPPTTANNSPWHPLRHCART
jgi:hypothetical protein